MLATEGVVNATPEGACANLGQNIQPESAKRTVVQTATLDTGRIPQDHQQVTCEKERTGELSGLNLNPAFLDRPLVPRAATKLSDATALWIGPPPSLSDEPPHQDIEKVLPIARKIDFPGREARNRELGQAGEELVFEHERRLLTDAGHPELAKRVRWVSEEEGDGAGYDIASFSRAGGSRLIEVKTTNGWDRTPFYISPNELEVAEQRRDEWRLLRVWNFSREPRAFELRPPLEGHVTLAPTNFLASFR